MGCFLSGNSVVDRVPVFLWGDEACLRVPLHYNLRSDSHEVKIRVMEIIIQKKLPRYSSKSSETGFCGTHSRIHALHY